MDQTLVEQYIAKLPYNEPYTELPMEVRTRIVFGSHEMLKRRYDESLISDEVVALQSLYVAEGEGQEFAMFKRQGVTHINLDGLTITVKGSNVSPEVIALLGDPHDPTDGGIGDSGVFFGRLR